MGFMKRMIFVIAALLLTSCASSENTGAEYSAQDIMFAEMMIPHHEQAIEMSDLALATSQDPEVLALATQIKNAQAPEIDQMKSWGGSHMGSHAGHMMDGMLTDEEMQMLSKAMGKEFDRLFLEGMIKHHEGAIEMAEMVVDSTNQEVSTLANAIIATQKEEIQSMKELLSR
jgi:uncharacterized protein (DUF305 family)